MPKVTSFWTPSRFGRAISTNPEAAEANLLKTVVQSRINGDLEISKRIGAVMKPVFVSTRNGARHIHWAKLFAYTVALMLAAAAVAEGLSYLFTGAFSTSSLVFAETLAILLLVRILIRTVAYQPVDFEQAESP
jgi:hypothetical protein